MKQNKEKRCFSLYEEISLSKILPAANANKKALRKEAMLPRRAFYIKVLAPLSFNLALPSSSQETAGVGAHSPQINYWYYIRKVP